MGMSTVQKHHCWGYHVASEQTQLPPSKGAHVKIHQGRVYLGFALIEDEAAAIEKNGAHTFSIETLGQGSMGFHSVFAAAFARSSGFCTGALGVFGAFTDLSAKADMGARTIFLAFNVAAQAAIRSRVEG